MIPFLQYSEKQDLREKLHRAYFMKGDRDNEYDNKETAKKIAALRRERARLLGLVALYREAAPGKICPGRLRPSAPRIP